MSVMNEIKQNVIVNTFNLVYSAKVNMNAGDSIFMEGIYSDFLRQMNILLASITDNEVKKQLKTKIDTITRNAEDSMGKLNPIDTDAYTIDSEKKKAMLDAMIDILIALTKSFYEKGYIEASFLEGIRENLLAQLYDAVQSLSPDAVWISTELIMVSTPNDDAVKEMLDGLKHIRKTITENKIKELKQSDDALKQSYVRAYWRSMEFNKKLEVIVSVLNKYNLIETAYEK